MATLKKSTVTHKVTAPASKPAVKTAVKQVEKAAAKTEQLAKVAVKTAVKAAPPAAKPTPAKAAPAKTAVPKPALKAVTKPAVKEAPAAKKTAAAAPAKKSTGKPSTPKLPAGSRERMTQVLEKIENRAPAVLHSSLSSQRVVVEDHAPRGAAVQVASPVLASGVQQLAGQQTATAATTAPASGASVTTTAERTTAQATLPAAQSHTPRFAHGIAALAAEGSGTSVPFSHSRDLATSISRTTDGQGPAGSPFLTKPASTPPAPLTNPGLLERRFEVYNDGLGSYRWRLVHASTGMVLALSKEGHGTPTAACEAAETEARLYRPGTSTVIRLNYTPR